MDFSNYSKKFSIPHYENNMCVLSCFSCVQLYVTLWTTAHQAPLSKEFSRQEYWSAFSRTLNLNHELPSLRHTSVIMPTLCTYSGSGFAPCLSKQIPHQPIQSWEEKGQHFPMT